ncbi:Chorismate dehydratase [Pseudobythopirellula maris]|uniref:Chorismate dehydratase n=1 Tax=Pseudobythopirellula maris TaxID=2527991 RepID=A0A5C5ZR55_9BACT|nr:menaquinone biosynthesis protein [Pseudobythopirellula maris]TWT90032.1 Chorismate dehydratase [Pseudobythopirellula maris]
MSTDAPHNPQQFPAETALTPLRVGAVNYLNSKPLVEGFDGSRVAEGTRLSFDLPSRLADALAAGRLDVALVPVFEALRQPGHKIVSDACVASRGPVRSVKLYFRTEPARVRRLALDEGSRTSAALSRVLLGRRLGVEPERTSLPLGSGLADADADAVLLIGDRAMLQDEAPFHTVWDLGAEWLAETGLPFVFACWCVRTPLPDGSLVKELERCRDRGLDSVEAIAQREAPALGLTVEESVEYLSQNLKFRLGPQERQGLARFRTECEKQGLLAPNGAAVDG